MPGGPSSWFSSPSAQPALLAMGAGVLVGAVAGTAIVASGALSSPASQTLALVACPGSDRVVARVPAGASTLVTARSADGAWLELYIGEPGRDSAWAPRSALRFTDAIDRLPVEDCRLTVAVGSAGPAPSPAASSAPTPGATFVATVEPVSLPPVGSARPPTPTPQPTPAPTPPPGFTPPPTATPPQTIPPTTTPTLAATAVPTPTPDVTGPAISGFAVAGTKSAETGRYYVDFAGNNCGWSTTAVITATILDSSGVNASTVFLRFTDTLGVKHLQAMTLKFGTKSTWTSTITHEAGWTFGEILWSITAKDNKGNTTTTPAPPNGTVRVFEGVCIE